jgi:hypothetical protein
MSAAVAMRRIWLRLALRSAADCSKSIALRKAPSGISLCSARLAGPEARENPRLAAAGTRERQRSMRCHCSRS